MAQHSQKTGSLGEAGKVSTSFFPTVQRQANDSGATSEPVKTDNGPEQDCTGWEGDAGSFCTKIAKHFLLTEFGQSPEVSRVEGFIDGGCRVFFDEGTIITVQKLGGQKVFVQVSPGSKGSVPSRAVCYTYVCFVSGKLELTKTSCRAN